MGILRQGFVSQRRFDRRLVSHHTSQGPINMMAKSAARLSATQHVPWGSSLTSYAFASNALWYVPSKTAFDIIVSVASVVTVGVPVFFMAHIAKHAGRDRPHDPDRLRRVIAKAPNVGPAASTDKADQAGGRPRTPQR